jgi:hypothetical protein
VISHLNYELSLFGIFVLCPFSNRLVSVTSCWHLKNTVLETNQSKGHDKYRAVELEGTAAVKTVLFYSKTIAGLVFANTTPICF